MIDFIFGIIAVIMVVGIVAGVIWGVKYTKEMQAKKDEWIRNLTTEQKSVILNTPYRAANDPKAPNAAIVKGIIVDMKEKGANVLFIILFSDIYFPNSKGIGFTDIVKLSVKETKERGLKTGDYVDMMLNEDKTPILVFENRQ